MKLQGTYTALVTPFTLEGEVDYPAFQRLIDMQLTANVEGILLLGTTGESPTISAEEREQMTKLLIEKARGQTAIIVGTGTNNTAKTIQLTQQAKELGADAVLIVSPYYNKPTQQGLYKHFLAVAEAVNIPQIVYNIQGRTGVNVETSTLVKLSKHKNVVGVKEASGDLAQMKDVIRSTPDDFWVLSGDDSMACALIEAGGSGVVSVLSNLLPEKIKVMIDTALVQNSKTQEMHNKLFPLMNGCFIETNPIPIKTALAEKGLIKEFFRLPMCTMDPDNRKKWIQILKNTHIL